MANATGTFDVKLVPQPADGDADPALGRMSIDKQFHGDLEGTSKGQMLTAGTGVAGSGAYVAVEKVSGSFILQHRGIMTRGAPQLTITVVPDSGRDELAGLSGNFTIKIDDGKHSYDFEYMLAEMQ